MSSELGAHRGLVRLLISLSLFYFKKQEKNFV